MTTIQQGKLIVFDLDETLVHASTIDLGHPAAFSFPPYFVYKRPFLSEMLEELAANYDLANLPDVLMLYYREPDSILRRIRQQVLSRIDLLHNYL